MHPGRRDARLRFRLGRRDLQSRAAVRALFAGNHRYEGLADRTEDIHGGGSQVFLIVLSHGRGHVPEVEGRRAAVEADVTRLQFPVTLIGSGGVDVDFREERAEEGTSAAL
jgi:hypothetical protein